MKTFFEFFKDTYIPKENEFTNVRIVDGNDDKDDGELIAQYNYTAKFIDINKEQHTCWVKILEQDWAWPTRFFDIIDKQDSTEIRVRHNENLYPNFTTGYEFFIKAPKKVQELEN